MAGGNRGGAWPPQDDIRAALDDAADMQGPGPVALVLLGFAFLVGFTVLAVIAGLGALQALLVGWVGALLCVILAAVWGALVEERAFNAAAARDTARAARAREAQVKAWDDDAAADAAVAVEILDAEILDTGDAAVPGGLRDVTPKARRA
ncbi:hypothetical protein ACVDG3_21810 [Meridianimarinicoccus sp. RP-17]|uniref:hypothetical protein n=1 Tax=Meridianimarinicoccus zhengii TaxID=2056810 RepID=UPI0013A6BC18|nr:hypothetical protein [Phycocomes zhengii]